MNLMNYTHSKPRMNENTRLSLFLSFPTHPQDISQISFWRSCLRADFFLQMPATKHYHYAFFFFFFFFLWLVSLLWWHLFPHNRFIFCSLYINYYVWFLVNKNLIAAKVVLGKDRGKHYHFISHTLLREREGQWHSWNLEGESPPLSPPH